MGADPSLLAGLEAAVAAAPDNGALRLHLAQLLLEAGRPADALAHCRHLLAGDPAHGAALALAATAAEGAGDTAKAAAYGRLAAAIEGPERTHAPAAAEQPPAAAPAAGKGGKVVPLRVVRGEGGKESEGDVETETPDVTLADVAGMDEVKRRLELSFLAPLRNPELQRMFGKSLRGGLLLYGPPGCGKTFLARAVAGELGARFLSVGLSDVLDMWLGNSERNLHELFETARRSAPCVLFFDELDALGRKRSLIRHHAERNVVNQMLAEMDSVGSDNKGVFVLAATNHPWDVDSALRRPGRLDRTLLVLPPDRAARAGILRYHLRGRPLAGVDPQVLADRTVDFSGADLAHLCDSAAELAMEDCLRTGVTRPIALADFERALGELRPSTGPWFETAKSYAQFANEGGVYDELLTYLRKRRWL